MPGNVPVRSDQLRVEHLPGVVPFAPKEALLYPHSVPQALRQPLFGRAGEMGSFALLDGAAMANLPDTLASLELRHRCIFQDDPGVISPCLVQLEPEHRFTRNLFTTGDAPWLLWDKAPGVFLRARVDIDGLSQHLRQHARLRDGQGKWRYAEFWQPRNCVQVLSDLSPAQRHRLLQPIMRLFAVTPEAGCVSVELA